MGYQTRLAKIDESGNILNVIIASEDKRSILPNPSEWVVGFVSDDDLEGNFPYPADKFYNCPSIGGTWDSVNKAFIDPQPYPSWTLSTTTYQWSAPVNIPADAIENGGTIRYDWDEDNLAWATN